MKHFAILVSAALCCAPLSAGPAPWYKWHSNEGEYDVCAQFSPGDGWFIIKGPFEDAACKKLLPR